MIQQKLGWRFGLIAVIIAACLYYSMPPFAYGGKPGKIKLGLDLQGGMHLILRVDTSKLPLKDRADAAVRAVEIIRNRIDQFGVSEPSIQIEGIDRIVVQLPGVTDRERALALLGKTALLEFKLVSEDQQKLKDAMDGKIPEGYELKKNEEGGQILVEKKALLTGKHIVNAGVSFESQFNEPVVTFEFDSEGGKIFSDATGANVGRKLAIVLDDKIQSAPVINERIPAGRGQITGRFTYDTANDLAIVLRAGALPCPILVEEERNVGPSLGKDSVEQGLRASLVGIAGVVAFMAAYYLFSGIIANVALLLNILIILAALGYFRATLTLPGIAGTVLTIGMAVDANVLIFERIREELALKKPMVAALAAGYHKAFSAILDSNLTTILSAAILYYIGTGPIRGFALTLTVGLLASLFTSVFVTRAIFDLCLAKGSLKNMRMLQFFRHVPNVQYLSKRKICYALSIAFIAWGLIVTFQRGSGMFGVEFSGGSMQEYRFKNPIPLDKFRKALTEIGYGTATIQRVGETKDIIVRAPQGSEEKIAAALTASFPDNPHEVLRLESIGPVVGKEMRVKAVWALILSLLAIWLYVVVRFDFQCAFGAILSLAHDGLATIGLIAISGREFSVTVLAAILTILGFSINDTIVIFDRIRERRRMGVKESFEVTINTSINQTMSRTLLTNLTVLLVVASLFFFGGEVINDFAFAMLFGCFCGTYSTIFIAAPVLVDWPGRKKK